MAEVQVIPPKAARPDTLRVAAYCRVSSDSADQLHSYAAQIRAYTQAINAHDGWNLVDIYADEGLTGMRMDKREDFNRLMADCRKGKIDKIVVKSISRFARNTRDCLATLRELSSLGVTVKFEKENIILSNGHAIVCNQRSTEFLIQNDISALRSKCDLYGVCQLINTSYDCISCICIVFNFFCHDSCTPFLKSTDCYPYSTTAMISLS